MTFSTVLDVVIEVVPPARPINEPDTRGSSGSDLWPPSVSRAMVLSVDATTVNATTTTAMSLAYGGEAVPAVSQSVNTGTLSSSTQSTVSDSNVGALIFDPTNRHDVDMPALPARFTSDQFHPPRTIPQVGHIPHTRPSVVITKGQYKCLPERQGTLSYPLSFRSNN